MSVVSVRVDERVKRILEEHGVKTSEEVRKYLQQLAWKLELQERLEWWDGFLKGMPETESGFAAKSVREDRESH